MNNINCKKIKMNKQKDVYVKGESMEFQNS